MPNNEPALSGDRLGVLNALVMHMRQGCCCDELQDERMFSPQVLRLQGKIELVVDENFGGDYAAFHYQMLVRIFNSTVENDDPMLALECWLDIELEESAKLYR